MRALGAVLRTDWESYLDLMALTVGGWDELDETRSLREQLSRLITQAETLAIAQASASHDATAIAGDIRVPTLVINPDYMQVPSADMARAMVSRIPGAKLRLYGRGETPGQVSPWSERQLRVYAYIEEFLAAGDEPQMPNATDPGAQVPSAFRTVLFTDLVGHTEMMQRPGDKRGSEVLRDHERITREMLKKYAGTEIKTDGDSFMVSFVSVAAGVECAIELQRAFTKYSETAGEHLVVRMGLNAGEPIEEDGDLFGATVILASRIAAKSEGGEILVADTVRGLCSGKGFVFSDRGEFIAKGIEEPVRVYEVRWRDDV
jgi:class 3 adenylate cyclase